MPARPPPAPGTVPAGLIGVGRLPQHEIRRVLFVRCDLHPGAGDHLAPVPLGEFSVFRHGGHVEQHMAFRLIGVARLDQALDHGDHLGDMIGGAGFFIGIQRAQRRHVLVKGLGGLFRQGVDGDRPFLGRGDDLVIDIGNISDIGDPGIGGFKQPVEHVEHHHRPGVADMGAVIDGGTAHIHAHVLGIEGDEILLRPRKGVIELYSHPGSFRNLGPKP